VHQVVPRLKPGGRKKLCDGLEAQDAILLYRWFAGFTDKRKLFFKEIFYSFSSYKTPRTQRKNILSEFLRGEF
jgi:hypothetical protein